MIYVRQKLIIYKRNFEILLLFPVEMCIDIKKKGRSCHSCLAQLTISPLKKSEIADFTEFCHKISEKLYDCRNSFFIIIFFSLEFHSVITASSEMTEIL